MLEPIVQTRRFILNNLKKNHQQQRLFFVLRLHLLFKIR